MTARPVVRGFTHGESGYKNYGCRCNRCRAGHASAHQRLRAERQTRLAADPSLAAQQQLNHDLVVAIATLRFRRQQRGRRWMRRMVARRGWLR